MASSNDFGMPVTNSPPTHQTDQATEIPAEWSTKYPAKALAVELSQGAPIPFPAIGDTFPSHNHFRILTAAHAIQQNWLAFPRRNSPTSPTMYMFCSRGNAEWAKRVGGKCNHKIKALRRADGAVVVTEIHNVHTHELDGKTPSQMPFLPSVVASMELEKSKKAAKEIDISSDESESSDMETAADGMEVNGRSTRNQHSIVKSDEGKKRAREEEIVVGGDNPPVVAASKSSNDAGLMLPPPKRSSQVANAVASGSGSNGTVATQYSGSSSQRRLLPSSTTPATAPRLPPSIPVAPRPWPVELARLIAIANTVLLDLSHVFAAIFIEAGVVNRYEFSKLLWTFSSENMKDERMLWFIERLLEERNGIALSRLQVIQFRSGAKRLFARIVAKTAKK